MLLNFLHQKSGRMVWKQRQYLKIGPPRKTHSTKGFMKSGARLVGVLYPQHLEQWLTQKLSQFIRPVLLKLECSSKSPADLVIMQILIQYGWGLRFCILTVPADVHAADSRTILWVLLGGINDSQGLSPLGSGAQAPWLALNNAECK